MSAHAQGRLVDHDPVVSEVSAHGGVGIPSLVCLGTRTTFGLAVLVCFANYMLDLGEEVVVTIDSRRCSQLALVDICCWISLAVAGCSLLVTLVARQRTCPYWAWTPWTPVFGRVGVATEVSKVDSDRHCKLSTYQMLQRADSGASAMAVVRCK